ncbi:MAG: gamma-glutamyl-gamma-aminobutyrate hydrolase family protein [Bryobacteraceae bacterium]
MAAPKAGLTFRFKHKAEPYAEALRQAGIEPVPISPDQPRKFAGIQGLLLSGGADVDPSLYGGTPHPDNEAPDNALDTMERDLLAEALANDVPVLAICRGMQLLNVAHGGTLIQHLRNTPVHRVRDQDPALAVHQILVEPGTRIAAILGEGTHAVNSRHHQAVERVGEGLQVTARSTPDSVVEALERGDRRFVVGVQWHPEDQVRLDKAQEKLFEAFAAAIADRRG